MLDLSKLRDQPRLLIEADLHPVQGTRFQPTGFPDLGAAEFKDPDGEDMLLVESSQSVANHVERTVFREFTRDWVSDDLHPAVAGLPYVQINLGDYGKTSTLLEAHRLNTPYLWNSDEADAKALQEKILADLGIPAKRKKKGQKSAETESGDEKNEVPGAIDMKKFYATLLKYDPNCLLHGVFLEKVAGRLRVPRALSGFIEAEGAARADSGGVKNDHVFPKKDAELGVTSDEGYVNVPYPRTDYVARNMTAYFNLDLAQIRGFGLGENVEKLLVALALFKIQRFLATGLRLRAGCDLETNEIRVTRPGEFICPDLKTLEAALPDLVEAVAKEGTNSFAEPRVSTASWKPKKSAKPKEAKS